MTISTTKKWTTLLLILFAATLSAQVKLSPLFSGNMVLQQGIEIPVWGWASPGEKVTVTLEKGKASAKANKEGKWTLKLPAMNYGGPFTMTVKGKNIQTLENIMIGEVWVCSGQSNMEFAMRGLGGWGNYKPEVCKDVSEGKYPGVRLFTVQRDTSSVRWSRSLLQFHPMRY